MKKILPLIIIFLFSAIAWSQNDSNSVVGTVYGRGSQPLSGVEISKIGALPIASTDENGEYSIVAKPTDTLVFSYDGYYPTLAFVSNNNAISVYLQEELSKKRVEKVVGPLGIRKSPDMVNYATQKVEQEELLIGRNPNTLEALNGKVSGLTVRYDPSGKPTTLNIRGNRSLLSDNSALVVIDGIISDFEVLSTMDNNIIESITVNKGASGAVLYGSRGANGVVMVTTKKSAKSGSSNNSLNYNNESIPRYGKRLKVNVKENTPDYLRDISSTEDAFTQYQTNRDNYWGHSAYFLDMYKYFDNNGKSNYSQQVFDDVINSDKADYATLRAMAYYLESKGSLVHANVAYNKVLNSKSDDAKSYRHMALINQELGKNQVAFNTLNVIIDNDYMYNQGIYNASKIKGIAMHELNNLLQNSSNLDTKDLNGINEINTAYDLRIVMESNRDDVNLNLKVVEPYLEISSADNDFTRIGGEMNTLDGLSEYALRNARKGSYYVVADYSQNPEEVVSFIKITAYKNYGKSNATKTVKMLRLTNNKKDQVIYKVDF